MSPEEKSIWYELSEASKDNILVNPKTPHKSSTRVTFHDVTLGDLIKANLHHFDHDDTNNNTSNVYPTVKSTYTDEIGKDGTTLKKYTEGTRYLLNIYRKYFLVPIHLLHRN